MTGILSAFEEYPKEGAIIGRLLAGYGELEFELGNCVGAAIGDTNTAMRVVFRLKGEESRISVVDALIRPDYYRANLKNEYEAMIGAFRCCKKIRNQYAHCHWQSHTTKGLYFTDLEDPAKTSIGNIAVSFRHIDVPLLERQEQYFCYCFEWLTYLSHEYGHRVRGEPIHVFAAPKIREKPPLNNPPEIHGSPIASPTARTTPKEGRQESE